MTDVGDCRGETRDSGGSKEWTYWRHVKGQGRESSTDFAAWESLRRGGGLVQTEV